MSESCGQCKYFVMQLSHKSFCSVYSIYVEEPGKKPEQCTEFRRPYETEEAIRQTKIDLFDLAKEIGQDSLFEIFDEYLPEDDDNPPSWLFECLFGNTIFNDKFDQSVLASDYLTEVWKRVQKRDGYILNFVIDSSERKQGLQSRWLRVKRAAFERDGYKCQICGSQKYLCGHHVKERAQYPELAYEVSNIITLCKSCHAKQHPGKENLILKRKGENDQRA